MFQRFLLPTSLPRVLSVPLSSDFIFITTLLSKLTFDPKSLHAVKYSPKIVLEVHLFSSLLSVLHFGLLICFVFGSDKMSVHRTST